MVLRSVKAAQPTQRRHDGDGLNDCEEINTHGTDPNNADTDDDGFADGETPQAQTRCRLVSSWAI